MHTLSELISTLSKHQKNNQYEPCILLRCIKDKSVIVNIGHCPIGLKAGVPCHKLVGKSMKVQVMPIRVVLHRTRVT